MLFNKNTPRWELPCGVEDTVRGICRDYERKRQALIGGELTEPVRQVYESYNKAVNNALLEIERELRGIILSDISEGVGYRRSRAKSYIAHNGYFARKRRLIYNIAKNLYLI